MKQPLTMGTYGALVTTSILALIYNDRVVFAEKRNDLEAPNAWPLIGSFPTLLQWLPNLHEAFLLGSHELDKTTYALSVFLVPHMVVTLHPANVEHILKTNFENYIKGPHFSNAMDDLFGHGIFNANGEEWRYQRKTASHVFNVKNFRDQFTDVFLDEMKYMTTHVLDKAAEQNHIIDFHDLMYKFTLDSFILLGFGVHLNSLQQEGKVPFAAAFDEAQKGTFFRMINQYWSKTEPAFNFIAPWLFPNMKEGLKVVDSFAREVTEKRRADMAAGKTDAKDLLSRFMKASNQQGEPLDDNELRDIVLNFIIAGRDTTAQALSWCFYMLTTHPRVERKLYDEIDQWINDDLLTDSSALYEVIRGKMNYAHAVFFETLRLYPSVPLNQKYALNDDIWPDGTRIKKGDYVIWSSYAQGRSEKAWGPDAKHFRPERWINENGDLKRESQGQWPAFHAGPRTCLGQNLATLEAIVAIINLVRQYKFTLVPGQKITYQISLTLPMKYGLKLSVEKRQKKTT
ncbi:cytochrome P450 [Halteromyces radiatus]|uniref:cytochrome P450 n=1 Tax=Halteromyces radiatus TaxID=101107 RepID=UPI00221F8CAA|nr:cytochrome P450 [Halteromyces radiatus]KAI8097201.1 cytochrome P450 [Halteromyces radiatus]